MIKTTIGESEKEKVLSDLRIANLAFQKTYPGDRPHRQPVHTVYGGANLFRSDTAGRMGEIALRSLNTYAPDFAVMANVLELTGHETLPTDENKITQLEQQLEKLSEQERKKHAAWLPYSIYKKVVSKLEREAV